MRLSNVRLILAREVRDQLRDRRTLFIIAVLPLVLYPLLGMSLFQIAQFTQQQQARVLVVGAGQAGQRLAAVVRGGPVRGVALLGREGGRTARLALCPPGPGGPSASDLRDDARAQVQIGVYEAAIFFPPISPRRLEAFRKAIGQRREAQQGKPHRDRGRGALAEVPSPGSHLQHGQRQVATRLRLPHRGAAAAGRNGSSRRTWS